MPQISENKVASIVTSIFKSIISQREKMNPVSFTLQMSIHHSNLKMWSKNHLKTSQALISLFYIF